MSESLVTEGVQPQGDAQVQGQEPTVTDGQANNEPAQGIPDNYEFTMPEGVELDKALLNEFVPIAKELKLTQAQAQKLVDLQTKTVKGIEDSRAQGWETMQEQWVSNSKSDKEYGGLQFEANVALARKAVAQFGTDALKEALDSTGMGNHPEMLRFMYRVGKAISEDTMRVGQAKPEAPKDIAHRLYPTMN